MRKFDSFYDRHPKLTIALIVVYVILALGPMAIVAYRVVFP